MENSPQENTFLGGPKEEDDLGLSGYYYYVITRGVLGTLEVARQEGRSYENVTCKRSGTALKCFVSPLTGKGHEPKMWTASGSSARQGEGPS